MAVSHAPTVASAAPRTSRTGRRVLFFGTYGEMAKSPEVIIQEFLELDELKIEA